MKDRRTKAELIMKLDKQHDTICELSDRLRLELSKKNSINILLNESASKLEDLMLTSDEALAAINTIMAIKYPLEHEIFVVAAEEGTIYSCLENKREDDPVKACEDFRVLLHLRRLLKR